MPSVRTGLSCPRTPADHEVSVPSPRSSCILADLSSRLLLTSLQQNRPSPDPADEQPCFTQNYPFCSFLKPGVDPESHPFEVALALPHLAQTPWPQAKPRSHWEKSGRSTPSTGAGYKSCSGCRGQRAGGTAGPWHGTWSCVGPPLASTRVPFPQHGASREWARA